MAIPSNNEWWKIKVYNEVSAYLRHPNAAHKQNLQKVINEYETIFGQSNNDDSGQYSELEISMNGY